MNTVKIKNIEIGTGIPKICVPIVGSTRDEILLSARQLCQSEADIVEWRADWYEDVLDTDKVLITLAGIRDIMPDMPLLFTFRTAGEGGEREISPEGYKHLNCIVSESGYIDLIDVELFTGDSIVKELIETAHTFGVKVIVSNHDFEKTPCKEELVSRLQKMQELGADIPKIAVMPQNKKDVLTLLLATEEMASEYADRPIITMSMARNGVISRLCGEVFGSALTFGAVGKVSAPGQINVDDLHDILEKLHRTL